MLRSEKNGSSLDIAYYQIINFRYDKTFKDRIPGSLVSCDE